MADTKTFSLINDLFGNQEVIKYLHELDSDKTLSEINVYSMELANRIFPTNYNLLIYFLGSIFKMIVDNNALDRYFKFNTKYGNVISDMKKKLEIPCIDDLFFNNEALYSNKDFTVHGHCYFFHGTSYDHFKQILDTGYLKFTNYVDDSKRDDTALTKFFAYETGKVFLSDDFSLSARYAVKNSSNGIVMGFDLDGFTLEHLLERKEREFTSKQEIPIDRLKKAYRIDVINNQIQVNELEVVR